MPGGKWKKNRQDLCKFVWAPECGASKDAAFFTEFFERSSEGEERVGGRREPELPIPLQAFPLCEQIETDASRTAFGRFERGASRQHAGEAGHAFETFVRGGN